MTKSRSNTPKNSDLVTKKFMTTYIDGKTDAVMKYINFKIEPLENLKNRFDDLEDKMYSKLDWIIGTLKRMEEDMIISNKHFQDLKEKVDNHENRIVILEDSAG